MSFLLFHLAAVLGGCTQSQDTAVRSPGALPGDTLQTVRSDTYRTIRADTAHAAKRYTSAVVPGGIEPVVLTDSSTVARIDSIAAVENDTLAEVKADAVTVVRTDTARVIKTDTSAAIGRDTSTSIRRDTSATVRVDTFAAVRVDTSATVKVDTFAAVRADSSAALRKDTSEVVAADTSAIVMRFAGDCLLGGHYERAAWSNVHLAFQGLDLFRTADISLVNLENPVTTRGKMVPKTYNFRMQPRFLDALRGAGIGAVTIANNHVFDYGDEGLFDTFLYLDSAGIRYVGAGRNATEAHRPFIFARDSQSVSILGYYGGGEAPAATDSRGGVARRDLQLIKRDVRAIKEADSGSYVVVVLHWGDEKAEEPGQGQRAFARALIDAGVDAVIGHHPHVLQGIERYRNGVIVYSLGNFVFGGNSRHTYDTGVFEIVLRHGKPSFRFIPIGVREWRVSVLEGKDAERVTAHVRSLSHVFPSSIFTD